MKLSVKFVSIAALLSWISMSTMLAAAAPPWPIPPGIKTVEVNGYPMAYIEAGSGTPVVLIHGAWVDHRLFATQVAEFSKAHRAIAVSLRHYYPEPWDGKGTDFSVTQHANDVVALIRELKLGKVHLLGHSRGGAVAVNTARQTPELIRTLILEEAGGLEPLLADPATGRQRIEGAARLGKFVRSKVDEGDRSKAAQAGWDAAYGQGAWERMPPAIQQMLTDNIGTLATAMPIDAPDINCDDIRKFNFPVLPMQSARAGKIYVDMFASMRQCKSDIAEPLVVPDAGHNMHVDNPTFFNKAVIDFMGQN